jgi:hypothetical protein
MAHLVRVLSRSTSLVAPCVRNCGAVASYHSFYTPSTHAPLTPFEMPSLNPSTIYTPENNEVVRICGRHESDDDDRDEKLRKVCTHIILQTYS